MMRIFQILTSFLLLLLTSTAYGAKAESTKKHYDLTNDPIDVVIVTHPKDKVSLDYCIEGIKKYVKNFGRIIIVSPEKLTDKAEWVDEKIFPFSKNDVGMKVARGSQGRYDHFFTHDHRSPGWYLQQLLKLYAVFVIPNISDNILVVDSDTLFLNPVKFLNQQNGGLFCTGTARVMPAYFDHAERLIPGYKRIYASKYSVCHHMLFQRPILEDLFKVVEEHHQVPFWEAFCLCVDKRENLGASEFEIYYNFALRNTDQVGLRELKWKNSGHPEKTEEYQQKGFHYVSFHSYMRKDSRNFPETLYTN